MQKNGRRGRGLLSEEGRERVRETESTRTKQPGARELEGCTERNRSDCLSFLFFCVFLLLRSVAERAIEASLPKEEEEEEEEDTATEPYAMNITELHANLNRQKSGFDRWAHSRLNAVESNRQKHEVEIKNASDEYEELADAELK